MLAQDKQNEPWGWGRAGDMYDFRGEPHGLPGIAQDYAIHPTSGNIRKIALGRHHALFLRHNGTVAAWGSNCYGELGVPVTDSGVECLHHAPVEVDLPDTAWDVACGPHYSVFLLTDGRLLACGRNDDGVLGSNFPAQTDLPTPVEGREAVGEILNIWAGVRGLAVVAGEDKSVWWFDQGQATRVADLPGRVQKIAGIMGSGDNESDSYSQFGLAFTRPARGGDRIGPRLAGPALAGQGWHKRDIVYLIEGGRLVLEGSALCSLLLGVDSWRGELPMSGLCRDVALGEDFIVCLMNDGTVRTAGMNDCCQLGVGTEPPYSRSLLTIEGFSNVVAVAANKDVALAVCANGSVWGWGTSGFLLGTDNDRTRCRPAPIAGIVGAKKIEIGPNIALATPYETKLTVDNAMVEYDGRLWGTGARDWGHETYIGGLSVGTRLTMRALFPKPGFKQWSITLEGMSLDDFKTQCLTFAEALEQTEFTFTMPAAGVWISAEYNWYDVTALSGYSYNSLGMFVMRYIPGEVVELVPLDADICGEMMPCRFVRWEGDVESWLVGPDTPRARFTMPAHDVTVQPIVESTVPGSFYLNVVRGEGTGQYAPGQAVSIKAEPAQTNFDFSGWTSSSGVVIHGPASPETTVTMPDHDAIVTARFVARQFQETQAPGDQGWTASRRGPALSGGGPESVRRRAFLCELPFVFPFFDRTVRRLWASSDGYLDLTENGVYAHSVFPSEALMTTEAIAQNAIIAPLAAALDAASLDFSVESQPKRVRMVWSGLATGGGPVNFEAVLFDDGRVRFNYGEGNGALDARVALSAGDGNRYQLSATHDHSANLDRAASILFVPQSVEGWKLTVENGTGSGRYPAGQVIEVQATTPPVGLVFDRWTGDTAGLSAADQARTTFTMPDHDSRLGATFRAAVTAELVSLTIRFVGDGSGSVTVEPSGETCHGSCTMDVPKGGALSLVARAEPGSVFEGWQGGCTGSSCELAPLSPTEVVARFVTESARCDATTEPTGRGHRAEGGNGAIRVIVSEGCPWSAESKAAWITIEQGAAGRGAGTVEYSVAANTAEQERMGAIAVAGRSFLVQQAGVEPCRIAVLPSNRSHGSGEAAGAIEVFAPPRCGWSALTLTSWIHLDGDASGTGEGAVNYYLEANQSTACRTGAILVENHVVEILQAAPIGTRGWISLGPVDAGVESLTVDPVHTNILYAGTDDGIIFKSTTGGATWTQLNTGLQTYDWVNSIAVDPRDSTVLYAATLYGGVLKSHTAGEGWSAADTGLPHTRIDRLMACPEPPGWLYALPSGEGVYRSIDGGESWSARNNALGSTAIACLDAFRSDGKRVLAGGPFGIYRSDDGGDSWQQTLSQVYCGSLRFHPWNPDIAYAGRAGYMGGGVLRTRDGGVTWQPTGPGLPARDVDDLLVHPAFPNIVFVATDYGVYRTLNEGVTWQEYNTALPAGRSRWIRALAITRRPPFTLYAGAGGYPGMGVYVYRESEGEGQDCTGTVTPDLQTLSHPGGPGSATLSIGQDCCWTAEVGDASWITLNSPTTGQGTTTLEFTVAPNLGLARAGTITIGGAVATVIQSANPGLPPEPVVLAQADAVGLTLAWDVVSGRTYRVEYSNSLGSDSWVPLPGDMPARGAIAVKIDPTVVGVGTRYYRVRVVP